MLKHQSIPSSLNCRLLKYVPPTKQTPILDSRIALTTNLISTLQLSSTFLSHNCRPTQHALTVNPFSILYLMVNHPPQEQNPDGHTDASIYCSWSWYWWLIAPYGAAAYAFQCTSATVPHWRPTVDHRFGWPGPTHDSSIRVVSHWPVGGIETLCAFGTLHAVGKPILGVAD